MATQDIAPYNTYTGNGVTTEFSVGFPYINASFVHVYVRRVGEEQVEIPSTDFDWVNKVTIRYPGNNSGDDVLADGDIISIHRQTPLKSDYVFSNQKRLFPEDVMNADDLEMQINQEQAEELNRCFRLNQTAAGTETLDLTVAEIVPNRALKWSSRGKEIVSSEYDPDEQVSAAAASADAAAQSASDAEDTLDDVRQIAYGVKFGMASERFNQSDWQVSGDKFKIVVPDVFMIGGIYKLNGTKYEEVVNVDVDITDVGATLTSLAAFDGYYLIVNGVNQTYTHIQSVADDTWVIEHNLGKYPRYTFVDENMNVIEGGVHYDSLNQMTVTFSEAESGKAFLD